MFNQATLIQYLEQLKPIKWNAPYLYGNTIDAKRSTATLGRIRDQSAIARKLFEDLKEVVISKFRSASIREDDSTYDMTFSYSDISNGHTYDSPALTVHDPCMVNPNSYATLIIVLDHLKQIIDGEWVSLVCDGGPYNMVRKLIMKDPTKYDWILLRAGPGHIEINMFKAYFSLYWDVFIGQIGRMLGFKTPKAQAYCKSASDHHKTWDIILMTFEAGMLEFTTQQESS